MPNPTQSVKDISYTPVFARTRAATSTIIVNVGGARSSKSYSVAQILIEKLLTEHGKKFGICRKTFPALRMTAMTLFLGLLKDYGIYREAAHNKTFNTYTYGDNLIQFFGLDESEKIKSTEFNYIWMEEANEFEYTDYVSLKLRLSGKCLPGEQNHLYISLNPVDAHNWIATKVTQERDVTIIKSTFQDNPFLSQAYKDMLLDLINQDENSYRVYVLGEWGLLEGKIYSNYKILPELPLLDKAKWAYGLDFGLVNPSAVVKVYLSGDKFYCEERLYQSGLTNADIIEFLSHEARGNIWADSSAKQMIAEISQAGYACFPAGKDVKSGIDLCQRQTLFIPQASSHLVTEIQNYHWQKDKNSDGFTPEPVKWNDHLMDAMRYAIVGLTSTYGYATQRPRSTEPIKSLNYTSDDSNDAIIDRWVRK